METYKAGQGGLTRLTSWVGLLLVTFLGCVELYSWIQNPKTDTPILGINLELFWKLPILGVPLSWKLLLCLAVFIGLIWAVRRYMMRPATVDTLIEVEMEMKKVSWPTRDESMNATWVVIFVTLLITFLLFFFDLIMRYAFGLLF
jgi:preprotein translocase SecE subunit